MKTPFSITWHPLDVKKDENGGLWFRLPQWIVRGFRLKEYGTNMGKVTFTILRDIRCMNEISHDDVADRYFRQNWSTKLRRENKNNN